MSSHSMLKYDKSISNLKCDRSIISSSVDKTDSMRLHRKEILEIVEGLHKSAVTHRAQYLILLSIIDFDYSLEVLLNFTYSTNY